ncbi:hypothetical protein SAMN06298216_4367 [Spirosomataceae bacterium TFI 002]|nr:hypothetical protein SAMN06298216_4367 [Spirosomataceae bacterium TFI 002]
MIHFNGLNWVNIDCSHRAKRDLFIETRSMEFSEIDYNDYRESLRQHLTEHCIVKQSNFESNYRRRSKNVRMEFVYSGKASAFLPIDGISKIHLSEGLALAIEDAAQSITSDSRSDFAANIEDKYLEKIGAFPGVSWTPELSKILDTLRFVDYDPVIEAHKSSGNFKYSFFYKFLSTSKHRRKLADFISSYSLAWIIAHEDAHLYLGHVEAFKSSKGFGAFETSSMPFFEEFVSKKSHRDETTRLSAEVAADTDASVYLVDSIAWMDAYKVYPFLKEYVSWLDYNSPLSETESKIVKTVFLFRLCIISQVIALCVFERNTLKKSLKSSYYPTLATRILNCLTATSARFQAVGNHHPLRGLTIFSTEGWGHIFQTVAADIEIILKYIFDIGFVLQDSDISVYSKEEVLDFELNKQQLGKLALALKTVGKVNMFSESINSSSLKTSFTENEKISFLKGVLERENKGPISIETNILNYLDKYYFLLNHQSDFMLTYRESYQSEIKEKVIESHNEIKELFDNYELLKAILKP